ncbi:MAG TPA: phosphoadenylyl-sulfate reductase [Chitinophagales bacterium]|nr:phosphoadenylyl-sulfate reductase [Chitinophagales bacterium]
MSELKKRLEEINQAMQSMTVADGLRWLAEQFPGAVCYSTAFGLEGQVISHFIFKNKIPVKVFTIDTGRQFQETYNVWKATNEKYGVNIETYYPQTDRLQNMLQQKGPNSFYNSVEDRKECCYLRKLEPLNRALQGQKIWLSGVRATQSSNRAEKTQVEWDEKRGLIKVYPLFYWSAEEVKDMIRSESIPYNELSDKGFLSIGCAPCTRAVRTGDNERSGRWWWEGNTEKECGIHTNEASQPGNWTI